MYKSYVDLANENGITKNCFDYRVYTLKWNYKQSALTPKGQKPDPNLDDFDEQYITYKRKAEQKGIHIGLFNHLVIDRGMDFDVAIDIDKLKELEMIK